jgi:hypothetical protein
MKELGYLKKSVSFYNDDFAYLKELPGDNISDKMRNLIRKDMKNKQMAELMFQNSNVNEDIVFNLGSLQARCSFKSMYEVSQFYKELGKFLSDDSRLDLISTLVVMYSDLKLEDLILDKIELG